MKRIALVTGANQPIGRAVAAGLAAHGVTVLAGARTMEQAWAVASALKVHPVELDVNDARSLEACRQQVEKSFGRLDILINNAGAFYDDGGAAHNPVTVLLDMNLLGPRRVCKTFIPLMKQSGYGRIVNMSSSFAVQDSSPNRLSELALNNLTGALSRELKGTGILVNACCPGANREPSAAADTPIYLATLPENGPTGGFYRDRVRITW